MRPEGPKPREWPRHAIGPQGQRIRIDCLSDMPHGYRLEVPLAEPTAQSPKPGDRSIIDGVEHVVVPVDQVKKAPGRKPGGGGPMDG